MIGIILFLLYRVNTQPIKYRVNTSGNTIEFFSAKNFSIDDTVLKIDKGVLSKTCDVPITFNVNGEGTEYIRVYYHEAGHNRKYFDFEIIMLGLRVIAIAQFDEIGNQVSYHTF